MTFMTPGAQMLGLVFTGVIYALRPVSHGTQPVPSSPDT